MKRALMVAWWVLGGAAAQEVAMPTEVVFGAAFEVSVVSAGPFDPASLSPLVVKVVEREVAGDEVRVRLEARCYELGEVALAVNPPRALRVLSALPEPAGELEWPSDGYELARPAPSRWLVAGVTAFVIVAAYVGWRRLSRLRPVRPRDEIVDVWDAKAALLALEVDVDEVDIVFAQLKSILRRYCRERYGLRAEVRTSEELLSALPGAQKQLSPCLRRIDQALFSQLPLDGGGPERSRAHALAFVQAAEVAS